MGWSLDAYYALDTDELDVLATELNAKHKGSIAEHFFSRM
jgi:hypothetical protein